MLTTFEEVPAFGLKLWDTEKEPSANHVNMK